MKSYQKQDIEASKASTPQNETKEEEDSGVTNEDALNVAFWTFVGFMALEAVFAIIAGSQSMLEDAEAMSVDAITYLFNLYAEKVKNKPYSLEELELPENVRLYRRELKKHYLELIPPLISVTTLIIVTIFAIRDAVDSLLPIDIDAEGAGEEDDVNVNIMLIFSGLNLLLDFVNVFFFAKAGQAIGFSTLADDDDAKRNGNVELEPLVEDGSREFEFSQGGTRPRRTSMSERFEIMHGGLLTNLNMCSAWTHVCADTLRSTAVLIAAFLAFLFPDMLSGATADSSAALVVSLIILVSLIPLLRGLYFTAQKIYALSTDPARPRR